MGRLKKLKLQGKGKGKGKQVAISELHSDPSMGKGSSKARRSISAAGGRYSRNRGEVLNTANGLSGELARPLKSLIVFRKVLDSAANDPSGAPGVFRRAARPSTCPGAPSTASEILKAGLARAIFGAAPAYPTDEQHAIRASRWSRIVAPNEHAGTERESVASEDAEAEAEHVLAADGARRVRVWQSSALQANHEPYDCASDGSSSDGDGEEDGPTWDPALFRLEEAGTNRIRLLRKTGPSDSVPGHSHSLSRGPGMSENGGPSDSGAWKKINPGLPIFDRIIPRQTADGLDGSDPSAGLTLAIDSIVNFVEKSCSSFAADNASPSSNGAGAPRRSSNSASLRQSNTSRGPFPCSPRPRLSDAPVLEEGSGWGAGLDDSGVAIPVRPEARCQTENGTDAVRPILTCIHRILYVHL